MKDKKYKSIWVAISSSKPIITQSELDKSGETFVTLDGIHCNPYISNGFISLFLKWKELILRKNNLHK
ncbi:hypothetical protein JI638_01950 [Listeria ivanovii subsp. londoniensis]|nr:hypothetical protein [Listeria ivanovii subsp. londoniensis]